MKLSQFKKVSKRLFKKLYILVEFEWPKCQKLVDKNFPQYSPKKPVIAGTSSIFEESRKFFFLNVH